MIKKSPVLTEIKKHFKTLNKYERYQWYIVFGNYVYGFCFMAFILFDQCK